MMVIPIISQYAQIWDHILYNYTFVLCFFYAVCILLIILAAQVWKAPLFMKGIIVIVVEVVLNVANTGNQVC